MNKLKDFWTRKNKLQKALLILLGVLIALSAMFGGSGSDEETTQPLSSGSESSSEPQSSTKPSSTATEDLATEKGLTKAIKDKLGNKTNRGPKNVSVTFDGRDLYVDFALDDNITSNLIIVGAWSSTDDIIKLAQKSGLVDNLTVNGTFELQDKLGNSVGEVSVFTANFLEKSIPKINTEAFVGSMYADAATSWRVHPAFQ